MKRRVTGCNMPVVMEPKEAGVFRLLHDRFCANDERTHDCVGRITIQSDGVLLQCKLCGDAKKVYPE